MGLVVLAVAGCGGSNGMGGGKDGGTDAPPPATAAEFCEQVEAIQTALFVRCYGGKASDWPIYTGESACPKLAEEIEKHRLTYDGTKATACLAKLATPLACAEEWPERTCVGEVLAGAVADGQPCDNGYVCHPGSGCGAPQGATDRCVVKVCQRSPAVGEKCEYFCKRGASCTVGVCVPNLPLGAPCGEFDDPLCAAGLYCSAGSGEPTCKKLLEGGLCMSSSECFDFQFCDTSTTHCRARLGLGADCSADPGSCQSFTACDPVTKRCVEASRPGQLCGNLIGYPFLCAGGTCVYGTETNHCVNPRANGAACAQDFECSSGYCNQAMCADRPPNDGAACVYGDMCSSKACIQEICMARKPNGARCDAGSECSSGLCTASVCTEPSASGVPCSFSYECASGFCSGGACSACP